MGCGKPAGLALFSTADSPSGSLSSPWSLLSVPPFHPSHSRTHKSYRGQDLKVSTPGRRGRTGRPFHQEDGDEWIISRREEEGRGSGSEARSVVDAGGDEATPVPMQPHAAPGKPHKL